MDFHSSQIFMDDHRYSSHGVRWWAGYSKLGATCLALFCQLSLLRSRLALEALREGKTRISHVHKKCTRCRDLQQYQRDDEVEMNGQHGNAFAATPRRHLWCETSDRPGDC